MTNQPFAMGRLNFFLRYMTCGNGIIVEFGESGSPFYSIAFFSFSFSFLRPFL